MLRVCACAPVHVCRCMCVHVRATLLHGRVRLGESSRQSFQIPLVPSLKLGHLTPSDCQTRPLKVDRVDHLLSCPFFPSVNQRDFICTSTWEQMSVDRKSGAPVQVEQSAVSPVCRQEGKHIFSQ